MCAKVQNSEESSRAQAQSSEGGEEKSKRQKSQEQNDPNSEYMPVQRRHFKRSG